jgi:hypothetical protein
MSNGTSPMFTGLLLFATLAAAQPLIPNGCQLPFAAISVPHPVDTSCTIAGKLSSVASALPALPSRSLRSNSSTFRRKLQSRLGKAGSPQRGPPPRRLGKAN